MKYLLDTSVIIDLTRKKNRNVYKHLSAVGIDECCIAAETVFELYAGACCHKADTEAELAKLDSILMNIAVASTTDAMREAGKQKALLEGQGKIIDDIDIIIASTAKVNGLVLVTGNEKHQGRIPEFQIENWRV